MNENENLPERLPRKDLAPPQNPIVPTSGKLGATVEGAMTRQAAEVQAAMVIAKNFPRDETAAIAKIVRACKRTGLAESAFYAFPRGKETVRGPSIRLAEALAQSWGNLDFGIVEMHQTGPDGDRPGESQVMAFCWDLETNTRQTKIFTVPHFRQTKAGGYNLSDPRDIYEIVANNGARRLRKCILGIIPGDILDLACEECEKTLAGNNAAPLIDDVRKLVIGFSNAGISQAMIENRLGHKVEETGRKEYNDLLAIYNSLRNGAAKREDFFESTPADKARAEMLAEQLRRNKDEREQKRNGNSSPANGPAAAPEAATAATDTQSATQAGPEAPGQAPGELFGQEAKEITPTMKFERLCQEKGFKPAGILKEYKARKFADLPADKQAEIIRMIENEPAGE